MANTSFSIFITTKNRKDDLTFTLDKISHLVNRPDVECTVYDDGSTDGTYEMVRENFPEVKLFRNERSKGLIHNRNVLLNGCKGDYAISLDDDAHILTDNVLEQIEKYFQEHEKCAVIATRIFWGKETPINLFSSEEQERVSGFVGCGHVWRMSAWRDIPDYPEWFVFYGEEDFASYQLFKKNWEIHYLPEILVHHRVDVKSRKNNTDYTIRLRRSLRSGWCLFFLYYPLSKIPRKIGYSVWMQLKLKVFKGDFKALQALVLTSMDLIQAIPKIIKNSNRLSQEEFEVYNQLAETKIYWHPEAENDLK